MSVIISRTPLAAVSFLLAFGGLSPAAAEDLTVLTWGGAYTKSQILGFIRDFESAGGVDVEVLDYNGGLDGIRDQVESYNVRWDVVALEPADAIVGCREGLLETVDIAALAPSPDGLAPEADFIAAAQKPCAVGSTVWSTVVAYDRRAVGASAPQRLEDFFDLRRFPGARGMRRTPRVNLEWALLADGVEPGRVYSLLETEEGLQRALRQLERIKPAIVWWQSGAEAPRLLEDGRVVMSTAYNGRIHDAVATRGSDLGIVWDRQVWSMDLWGIPVNGERTTLAREFVRYATRTESLVGQTQYITYGPTRRSAIERIDPATRAELPTAPENLATALELDAAWWAENIDRLTQRFERWVARPVRVPEALPR